MTPDRRIIGPHSVPAFLRPVRWIISRIVESIPEHWLDLCDGSPDRRYLAPAIVVELGRIN